MLILGIDPGTATTGYGLIRELPEKFQVVDFGLIETKKEMERGKRLISIHDQVTHIIDKYKPDVIAIERLFFATNAKTAMSVSQAVGVMMYAVSKTNIELVDYAPGTIKKVVGGDGRADKKAMQKALRDIFGPLIRSKPKKKTHFDNAADALAVALCHLYTCSNIKAKEVEKKPKKIVKKTKKK